MTLDSIQLKYKINDIFMIYIYDFLKHLLFIDYYLIAQIK